MIKNVQTHKVYILELLKYTYIWLKLFKVVLQNKVV